MTSTAQLGSSYPLGAHWDGRGVNFALFSAHADRVELCLFDQDGLSEIARISLLGPTHHVWHAYVPDLAPGQHYAYRVYGPHTPQMGHRFNPAKLLVDPYAREIVGHYDGSAVFIGANQTAPHLADPLDNANVALKCKVIDPRFDWKGEEKPKIALCDTVIYELHLKGFTQLHPDVPPELRGSYAGLATPAVLTYLKNLGITSVSLLPIHFRADEPRLLKNGLSNYWGYSTLGFFAPETRYWSGTAGTTPLSEFKTMVKALHSAGLEVILDVVYNHTAELDAEGPTLSFRGIDNASYYHLNPGNLAEYENWTGCGNSVNLTHPRVLQLVLDSLRYWVSECHVDGFRFDLAPILARNANGFDPQAAFFAAVLQDPILSQTKLIAEPWDIGMGGYRLGQFPTAWQEWNDQFRDTMRAFWLHQWPTRGEFARRFAGSSDIFAPTRRTPLASVNFITAHDGFTLTDLVSYNHKHNQANGEENRDGHSHNHSWNCGVEGPSDDAHVNVLRGKLKRSLLATLLLAQGTPMLLAGDELGHSQAGNNNAYCQDNPTTWINWEKADTTLSHFVSQLLHLRKKYPALHHDTWFHGADTAQTQQNITWFSPSGHEMTAAEWDEKTVFALQIYLDLAPEPLLILVNPAAQNLSFHLPKGRWQRILDTSQPDSAPSLLEPFCRVPACALWIVRAFNQ